MSQKLRSTTEKPWLIENNEESKSRIFKLGVKAIHSLLRDSKTISYRNIAERSKEFDESGKGIHPNSVKNNTDLYDYYLKHTKNKPKPSKRTKIKVGDVDFRNIKIDRDLERVKSRYLQLSKLELVELLINAEQFIAVQNQTWLKSQFENFK
ncbi:hypothetical protein MUG84_11415 [Paenibacillus sp. KQZ6P-2]|uniref:Uncharacterized protein n=1 Tax=Paenibacillus mangrovi TaxID=2931978 RepID=A0A9X1WQZ8_9BACL|nr:hypothetical protein [Paenibacillus mangrovi]MCJ8012340.1 hypothetical protein [Paenibacillus mangrovi]